MSDFDQLFKSLFETNFTKKVHRDVYPAIAPSRPELNQAGRVVLVPGGGTGVGFGIAQAFVRASADMVILIARRADVLATAAARLEEDGKAAGSKTKIMTRTCDVVNLAEVEAFWNDLSAQGITVDVFVANVAKFTGAEPLLELGADEVWSHFEVNVKSPLYFTEKFCSQPGDKRKFIVNVTSAVIQMIDHPLAAMRPVYILTKMSGTLFFQLIAQNTSPEKVQVVSVHPGGVYNDSWKSMGMSPEPFDSNEMVGGWAVWATTKEAEFLHGRYAWASWDVEELATGEIRKRIDEDPYFLRASVVGLKGGFRAGW